MSRLWSVLSLLSAGYVRTRGPAVDSTIYLSFDDGPHALHSARLLDLLAQHEAKATFFLLGDVAQDEPELVARMLAQGHAIGNHSMTHPRMSGLGGRAIWDEVDRADAVLARFDGQRRHLFRPPHGRLTPAMVAGSLWRRQPLVLWTLDSLDYKLEPQAVARRLSERLPVSGDVILFHDDGACAGEALEILLPLWKRAGLRFAALG